MGYDYDKTHESILKNALKHFAKEGFAKASIRQICKDSGVTNGAFYAHFKSKEDLFGKLVEPALESLRALYKDETSRFEEVGSAKDVLSALDQAFSADEAVVHCIYEHADAFRLLLTASNGTSHEHFFDAVVAAEKEGTIAFFEACAPYVGKPQNMSANIAAQASALIVSTVSDCLLAGKAEDEAVREAQLASEFCIAGLRAIWEI